MKTWLKNKVKEVYPDVDFEIMTPPDERLGDYSINLAFVLAKSARFGRDLTSSGKENKKLVDIGREIIEKLSDKKEFKKHFEKIELAGAGFINFYLSFESLQKSLAEIADDKNYGRSNEGIGKKIIVEYSSPNIAKPMHIGHLRSTIIGDSLANIYEDLGYEVVRWNFIGDWGTQFGKVIAGYKKWGEGKLDVTLNDMLSWYVRASKELSEEEGQIEFKKLEEGDSENRVIWKRFRDVSISDLKSIYKTLGTQDFNQYKGESEYELQLKPLIEELKKKCLAKESEGALIIELDNLPPVMLRKSDGATLYITRDIASLEDRMENYKPTKILYVVANQQALHFEQLFQIVKKLVRTDTELKHVKFGMVLGENGKKLATREGKVVPLQEVIDRLNELALKTVKEKNSGLSDEEAKRIAQVVSIGALKYNDLKQHPYSDITFDWKAMLDLSGNSGPYIQYTYARLMSILNKAGRRGDSNLALLAEPSSRALMRQLLDYPESISESARFNTLNGLALYLYELAHRANQFYEQIRILEDDNSERLNARLLLVKTTADILKRGLSLLGIETLERI